MNNTRPLVHPTLEAKEHDLQPLAVLVGDELLEAIVNSGPTKVLTRVAKAAEHVEKANRLQGVDEEMAVIRYIAAEEELVVAIFQWLNLNVEHVGAHQDFLRKAKNHLVKLAFPLVLQQLAFVAGDFLEGGITVDGLEDPLNWEVHPTIEGGRVMLQAVGKDGKALFSMNPLDVALTQSEKSPQETAAALMQELAGSARSYWDLSLREFVIQRADFRNKLLYADDAQTYSMNETLAQLRPMFETDLRHLLWALGCILTNKPLVKSWGLVNQVLAVYRNVLTDAKLLKASGETIE